MKGFKNSTKTQYSMGGDVAAYAKGGSVKGAAKVSKVMGEFKKGELHSGSKEGPKVTNPKQAKAIALSEARKAGAKIPVKKADGGKIGKMPPLGESVKSGNRMSKMTADEMRAMEARFGDKKRPSAGDSVKSGNRVSAQEAAEARALGVFKNGGKVAKYAVRGQVAAQKGPMGIGTVSKPPAMPGDRPQMTPAAAPTPSGGIFGARSPAPAAATPQMAKVGSALSSLGRGPGFQNPPSMMLGAHMPRPDYNQGTSPVAPSRAMMMNKGGITAMPKKGKC